VSYSEDFFPKAEQAVYSNIKLPPKDREILLRRATELCAEDVVWFACRIGQPVDTGQPAPPVAHSAPGPTRSLHSPPLPE
jgi:hypothetical protein